MTNMLCSICLRSNINLESIKDENLVNFYDELCDFGSGLKAKFCFECLHKLKKCYNFKRYCLLAVETLKTWAKQPKAERKPKNVLHTTMPIQHISLCNKNRYMVYYQFEDLNVSQIDNKHPNMVHNPTDKIIGAQDSPKLVENVDDEKHNRTEVKIVKDFLSDDSLVYIDKFNVSSVKDEDCDETIVFIEEESVTDDLNDSFNKDNPQDNSDVNESIIEDISQTFPSDSDDSMELNSLQIKRKKHKRKSSNLEDIKTKLKEKFERCGTVKDAEGNTINVDVVLNNLVESHIYAIKMFCLGPGPFSPTAIRKLSEICSATSLFDTLRLNTNEEMRAEFEKRSQYLNYTKLSHRCEDCLRGFLHKAILDFHIKTSHNPSLPFECSLCHMRMANRNKLSSHLSTHKNVFKCKLCAFSTGNRGIMVDHVHKHKGVRYACELCEKDFTSRTGLAVHKNAAHEARHACAFCAAAFRTTRGLEVHQFKKHKSEEFVYSEDNKKCEECDILFLSGDVYAQHKRITHKAANGRPRGIAKNAYRCRVCDWKGLSRWSQMVHYQKEHPETDSKFLFRGTLLCHDCGQRFKSASAYKTHMNRHTGTRPFSCAKCAKTFFSQATLDSHLLRHLPPSKECAHCPKKFTTSTGLSAHMRIHQNDRRYKCDICGKGFLYNSALTAHIAGVHYNKRRIRKPRQDVDSE